MTSRTLAVGLAAILGLVLAVTLAFAVGALSSQGVGLSGEPITAGSELVPRTHPAGPPQAAVTTPPAHDESRERGEAPDLDD